METSISPRISLNLVLLLAIFVIIISMIAYVFSIGFCSKNFKFVSKKEMSDIVKGNINNKAEGRNLDNSEYHIEYIDVTRNLWPFSNDLLNVSEWRSIARVYVDGTPKIYASTVSSCGYEVNVEEDM